MALTCEQWADIERRCAQFFTPVELLCDGFKLSLELQRIGAFKNAIAVYIDGRILGMWMTEDCEQRRRFLCPTRIRMGKGYAASLKFYRRYDKPHYKKLMANPPTIYMPYWTSFNAFKRHLIKHNTSIELVSETA